MNAAEIRAELGELARKQEAEFWRSWQRALFLDELNRAKRPDLAARALVAATRRERRAKQLQARREAKAARKIRRRVIWLADVLQEIRQTAAPDLERSTEKR